MDKCNWKGINYPSEKDDLIEKYLRKIVKELLVMFCILEKKKYILPMFQTLT